MEDKQIEQSDLVSLNGDLKKKKSAVEDNQARKRRVAIWEDAPKFIGGNHWGENADPSKPSLPFAWYIADSQLAKVFDRPVTVNVAPEQHTNYPLWAKGPDGVPIPGVPNLEHPFRQMLVQNAASLEGVNEQDPTRNQKTDNEYAAEFANALVQRDWQTGKFSDLFYRAGQLAAWLGESWILDGDEESQALFGKPRRFLQVLNPKCVGVDPEAQAWDEIRYLYHETPSTLGYIRKYWPEQGKKVKAKTADDKDHVETGIKPDDPQASVTLECWYVRNTELKTVADPLDPSKTYDVPLYPSGWAKTYRANNITLQPLEDAGVMPLHKIPWYTIPGTLETRGIYDLFAAMNFQIDQHAFYTLENAKKTSQNKVFARMSGLHDPESAFTNLPGGVVGVKSEFPITEVLMGVPGQPLASAHVEVSNWFRELMDTVSGVLDVRNPESLPRDASGALVRELRGSAGQRLAVIREQQIDRVAEEVGKNLIYYATQEQDPVTLKLPGDGVARFATVTPSVLAFSEEEFEGTFEVQANGTNGVPHDPIERDRYNAQLLGELMQMPPQLAELRLDLSAHPNKEQIRSKLQAVWEQQAQSAGQPNPVEQAKAFAQIAKDTSQFVQGASDNLSDKGFTPLAMAINFAAIPMSYQIAQGQPPDVASLIQQAQAMLPMIEQLIAQSTQLVPAVPPTVTDSAPTPMESPIDQPGQGAMPNG